MVLLAIHVGTKNDANGNPRRGWLVVNPNTDGGAIGFVDEAYAGDRIMRRMFGEGIATTGRIDITPTEYRLLKRHHELPNDYRHDYSGMAYDPATTEFSDRAREVTRHVSLWITNDGQNYSGAVEAARAGADQLRRFCEPLLHASRQYSAPWQVAQELAANDYGRIRWDDVAAELLDGLDD